MAINTKTPLRAGLYLRQSKDSLEGIDRQRTRCTQLADARGYEVLGTYEDNDISASKTRGEGTAWHRMLTDARSGDVDVIIGVDLDRLLRSIGDLSVLIDTGVPVVTVDGEIDLTTADGEFRATMLAGIARFETRRKSERQIRANAAAALLGKPARARRPFGYDFDGMTVLHDEAKAVADGYRDLLLGVPLAAIARDWNRRGFVTGQGRRSPGFVGDPSPWRADSVRVVLTNPRYAGRRMRHGVDVAAGIWPALVDEATWLAVQSVLNDPARRHSPTKGRYLLSGLAVCGICGSRIQSGGNGRAGVSGYRCSGSLGHFARRSAPVDEFVTLTIAARLARPDAAGLLIDTDRPDAEPLQLEAMGLRERRAALAREFATGKIASVDVLMRADNIMSERLVEIETLLAHTGRTDLYTTVVGADDTAEAFAELSLERRRAIIDDLATIRVHPVGRGTRTFRPETVTIDWKTP